MSSSGIAELNVGGHYYTASVATLVSDRESMLAVMFRDGQMPSAMDAKGRIFLDRDGTHFGVILNYLRDRQEPVGVSPDVRRALQAEARFYQIAGLIEWATKVDEEVREAEAAAVNNWNMHTERITASIGAHFEGLSDVLRRFNLFELAQQAKSLLRDAMAAHARRYVGQVKMALAAAALPLFSLAWCIAIVVLIWRASMPGVAPVDRKLVAPVVINVGGDLITASKAILSGDRRTARMAEIPYLTERDKGTLHEHDLVLTGRLYCYANELFAPSRAWRAQRSCKLMIEPYLRDSLPSILPSMQFGGELMGSEEFHAISKCWCALKQAAPARDERGLIYIDRDPDLMREIVRALQYPGRQVDSSREAEFCNEAAFYEVVDLMWKCQERRAAFIRLPSPSAKLAFEMLQRSLAIAKERGYRESVPLAEVVHNRYVEPFSRDVANPLAKLRMWLQSQLEQSIPCILAAICILCCCKSAASLDMVRRAYIRPLSSPMFGLFALIAVLACRYYRSSWDAEAFVGRLCPLPQHCQREDMVADLLLVNRLRANSELAERAYDKYMDSRPPDQSHECDRVVYLALHSTLIFDFSWLPLLLLSTGVLLCSICGLRPVVMETRGTTRLQTYRFWGEATETLIWIVRAMLVWIVRAMLHWLPACFVFACSWDVESPKLADHRHLGVTPPLHALLTLWEGCENWVKDVSQSVATAFVIA